MCSFAPAAAWCARLLLVLLDFAPAAAGWSALAASPAAAAGWAAAAVAATRFAAVAAAAVVFAADAAAAAAAAGVAADPAGWSAAATAAAAAAGWSAAALAAPPTLWEHLDSTCALQQFCQPLSADSPTVQEPIDAT